MRPIKGENTTRAKKKKGTTILKDWVVVFGRNRESRKNGRVTIGSSNNAEREEPRQKKRG